MEKNALDVPLACRIVDEVDAGFGEADGGELDTTTPERTDTEGCTDGVCADDRFGAERGVFVDDKIFESEAGQRKEVQADSIEMDRAAEAGTDAVRDALLIAADADQRRKEHEEKNNQHGDGKIEKPMQGAGAESRGDINVRGLAILVGWMIQFLHERCPARFSLR
jgi:hypothetical protein